MGKGAEVPAGVGQALGPGESSLLVSTHSPKAQLTLSWLDPGESFAGGGRWAPLPT